MIGTSNRMGVSRPNDSFTRSDNSSGVRDAVGLDSERAGQADHVDFGAAQIHPFKSPLRRPRERHALGSNF